ncbi:flagellar basal body P-ring formation chaperone FlgA [Stakelama marina]|uniref:Flagella basal body P-ring formation protein FlgA n=1 Tax=Stakelama marina TaxID=2826939 RepID=A0A8T4I8D5_9SPHN|nr:flagellar basal body P-ring formation chaperone FlgA [Stakelama marina]MBR0550927.1 flagellar basal body P-ring formation protein FlgA [Stakelama marina]
MTAVRNLCPLFGAATLLCAVPAAAQTAPATAAADVLTHTVQRGDVLTASDFVSEEIPVARARSVLSAQDAAGMEARRILRAGMPVRSGDLIEPRLVRRGEPVTISIRSGSLAITANGRALGDAALGEPVRVFSEATNHTLDAVVEGSGAVRIAAR